MNIATFVVTLYRKFVARTRLQTLREASQCAFVLSLVAIAAAMQSPAAQGQQLRTVYERTIEPDGRAGVGALLVTQGGDIVLCGNIDGADVGVLSPDGLIKQKLYSKVEPGGGEPCNVVLEHNERGTVIAGSTNSTQVLGEQWKDLRNTDRLREPTAALLAKFGANGVAEFKRGYGKLGVSSKNQFIDGAAVRDGYLLLGVFKRELPPGPNNVQEALDTLTLRKLSRAGDLVWEYQLTEGDGDTLRVPYRDFISNLVVLPDGSSVFGMPIQRVEFIEIDGKKVMQRYGEPRRNVRADEKAGFLVVKIGADGREAKRQIVEADGIPCLISANGTISLFASLRHTAGLGRGINSGVTIENWDSDLRLLSHHAIDLHPQRLNIAKAIPWSDGRAIVVGMYVEDLKRLKKRYGDSVLGVLDQAGHLRVLRRFEDAATFVSLSAGASPGEIVLVREYLTGGYSDAKSHTVLGKYFISK